MSSSSKPASERIDPEVLKLAFTIIVGALAPMFDTTIVSVGINDLARELRAPLGTIQWVSTGYLLAMFVAIPLVGWFQSRLGGKRVWLGSLGLFLVGSVLCALSWDVTSLIVFRVLQGVSAGVMMPMMMTLIMQAARGRNTGRLMATVSLPIALGPILGPVLGGLLLASGIWQLLFLINIPFCVVGLWLAVRNLPEDKPAGDRPPLDVVGILLLPPGAAALIYGLSQIGGAGGFGAPQVLIPLLAGAVLIAVFIVRSLPRGAKALVNISLFGHRSVASSSVLYFLSGATLYGAMLLLPLFWQQARGEDALGAGLLLIPQGIGTLLSRFVAGRYTDKVGARWVALIGFAAVVLTTVPFTFVTADTSNLVLTGLLLLRGLGMGVATIPLASAAYVGLDHASIPSATMIVLIIQQIGGSLGIAVLAVILQRASAGATDLTALTHAFSTTFWWSIGLTALAVPLCLLLPGRPKPAPAAETTAGAEVPAEA
ncbi:DHA2 family efflux MFS transporter permease subunit [Kutzneria kofuensis]|uniref:EmrB/QacA subfamily drug resistance transporter n=1 Tax=Kutzneria kofuensis TaxID=103725 RepID=A0A7W9KJU5_9PSEU|nr:DHA2 family efflux MFS transporter permease subunit [Kutzneria kofuensis]MBB5893772.1 EmrB/QacA subfamily drug resistance transporter [Kutzneria kofuensis]